MLTVKDLSTVTLYWFEVEIGGAVADNQVLTKRATRIRRVYGGPNPAE